MGLVWEAISGSETVKMGIAELFLDIDPFTELIIVPAGIFEAGYISTRLQW